MGLKEYEVFFDNQWATYYAGQTVSGRVEISVDSPKKVRGEFHLQFSWNTFTFSFLI